MTAELSIQEKTSAISLPYLAMLCFNGLFLILLISDQLLLAWAAPPPPPTRWCAAWGRRSWGSCSMSARRCSQGTSNSFFHKENKYLLSTLTTFPFTWSRCEGHRQPASPVSVAFVCCGPNNGNTENNLLLPHIYFYKLIPSDWACDEILICSKPNGKSFAKSILWKIAFANRYF